MILFIEDERMYNESYVEALRGAGYKVEFEHNLQRGLVFFKERMNEIELVIIDVMFPITGSLPRGMDESKIQGGLRTGEEVLRLLNDTPEGRKISKIFLTNVQAEDFHEKYKSSDEVQGCYRKRDVLPSDLVGIVKGILGE